METEYKLKYTGEQIEHKLDNLAEKSYVDNKISGIKISAGVVFQPEAPEDKTVLWVDTDDSTGSDGFSIPIVDSVEEMTDINKQYILKSTGTIWRYQEATVTREVKKECDEGYTYPENTRLDSSGIPATSATSYAGYTTTPFIDLLAYSIPFTLHIDGIDVLPIPYQNYSRIYTYKENQTMYNGGVCTYDAVDTHLNVSDSDVVKESNTKFTILFDETPKAADGTDIKYIRLCGTVSATPSVYITYEETTTGPQWVDTGISYGGGASAETLEVLSNLNNEGADPKTITLLPAPVLEFYGSAAYPDDDYTDTHLSKITYPCRADIPVPFTVKWSHNEDAMRTTVAVDTKAIREDNVYTMLTYDATGFDNYPLYNLLPNTTYYYRVTHIPSDGSSPVEAKSGSFTTSSEPWRLIYIDGTQNVRDLGGWTGLDGRTVKYGKIFRGAALSDSSYPELLLTGKGRRALGELKVQAELNLGAADTETSIAANCAYKKIGYASYATAITNGDARSNFKVALEWIVECLNPETEKPIYMHCQGGCDRTGTLAFQLLGLLGVSESDLAKGYELSSFSSIGFGRLRNANNYDYVGMVEAIKTYEGDTLTDKFKTFATECGISDATIESFREAMLN